jgi:uncharacterized repeat protein (TIGR01451 family)
LFRLFYLIRREDMSNSSRKYMLLGKVSYFISAALMIAALVTNLLPLPTAKADNGAIWTTMDSCGSLQNVNQYYYPEVIYINGANFIADTLSWNISTPGNGQGETILVQGSVVVGTSGAFCFPAYTIKSDWTDLGEWQANVDVVKGDNFKIISPPATPTATPIPPNPSLSLTKADSLNPWTYYQVGQIVAYALTATNTGNITLHGVTVSDNPSLAGFNCTPSIPVASLVPGASIFCTGTHSITQGDLDAGSFADLGSATSTEATSPDVSDTVNASQYANLGLTKTDDLNPERYDHIGQIVTYTLTTTNTGNITLHSVMVSDNPSLTGFNCTPLSPASSLTPGASIVCTGTHIITLADMDVGSFTDTASASSNEARTVIVNDTISGSQNSNFEMIKTDNLNPAKYDHVGQVVTYTLTATNTGNVTLHNVTMGDNPALDGFSCNPVIPLANLAPGASVVCTGTHTITQADLDAGSFVDTGYATCNEGCNPYDIDMVYGKQNTKLDLTKTDNLNPEKYDHVGQVVTYTLTATNISNIELHNVLVSDNPALDNISCNPSIPVASLAPGALVVCTGTHSTTQGDLDAGSFPNLASATSTEAKAPDAPDTISATQSTQLGLTKTDNLNPAKYDHVGQIVTYTLTATNIGNITLHGVTVSDNPSLTGFNCTPSIPIASLVPGASIVCNGMHTITLVDLDNGSFVDTASASSTEETAPNAPDTINANTNPSISLTKTDNLNPAKYGHVGQIVTYTLTATNTSNVTLHNVTVSDNPALTGFNCTSSIPAASLAPGDTIVCTGTHSITQENLDAGSFANLASATSTEANAPDAPDTIFATQSAQLGLTKTDDINPAKYDHVGQIVTYTLIATNNGNITLHGVMVSDNPALAGFKCMPSIPVASLVPGASIVCTGTHSITQGDLDAGSFADLASATSTEASAINANDTVFANQNAILNLTKTDNINPERYDHVGQIVIFTLTATNVSNVTLHNVTVNDTPGLVSFNCTPSIPATSLAPGASIICTGTHSISQADLEAESYADVAGATSTEVPAADAPDTINANQTLGLTIDKTVTESTYTLVGNVLHYSYVVRNTGNMTLTGLAVTDDKTTAACPKTTLAPAESMTCAATYVVSNADMESENITNTAFAIGLFGTVPVQSAPDSATVVRFIKLILTSLCAADPTLKDAWQVKNKNTYSIGFEYALDGGTAGTSNAPANSTTIFDTPIAQRGTGVMSLYVNGHLQNNSSAATGCNNPGPQPTPEPTIVPPIPTTVAGGPTVLIPVTGVDAGLLARTLPGSLLGLSFSFLGLGIVLTGIARRRED